MNEHNSIDRSTEELAHKVVDSIYQVHKALGPGLLEIVYQNCLCHELSLRGVGFEREVILPIHYKGLRLESGLRIDLLVGNEIILELKSVKELLPIHNAQLLTYLKLAERRLGFLVRAIA